MPIVYRKPLVAAVRVAVTPGAGWTAVAQQSQVGIAGTADEGALDKVRPNKPLYLPHAGRNFSSRPLFGDSHLHGPDLVHAGLR